MIIPTDLAVAFACPFCGRIIYRRFSLFGLKSSAENEVVCECGRKPCAYSIDRNNEILVELWANCCDDIHEFLFSPKDFQKEALIGLACSDADMGLGFIGWAKEVKQAAEECPLPIRI